MQANANVSEYKTIQWILSINHVYGRYVKWLSIVNIPKYKHAYGNAATQMLAYGTSEYACMPIS